MLSSLAGFHLTLIGRICPTPEALRVNYRSASPEISGRKQNRNDAQKRENHVFHGRDDITEESMKVFWWQGGLHAEPETPEE
ncbi:MAG TPA: hypothetical protein VMB03_03180, partial [Bryobacteraceae bacterium]|nr:hypothetical protein [Bryobacteraceae bacterium]